MGLQGNCSVTDLKQAALVNEEMLKEGFLTFYDQWVVLDILQIKVWEMLTRKNKERENALGLLPVSKPGFGYRAIGKSSR